MLKIYHYKGCDTCRKALRYLTDKGVAFTALAIREMPPTVAELKLAYAQFGARKPLCNVSGQDYRALKLKDTLADMSDDAFFALLHGNGNLVKRPFVVTDCADDDERILVGFKPAVWDVFFK